MTLEILVPDSAVEAGATVLCRDLMGSNDETIPCEGCRSDAEAIVTAAAPHIEARATDDLRARIEALRDSLREDAINYATIPGARITGDTLAHYADAIDALIGGA